jgi:hypothetical protein
LVEDITVAGRLRSAISGKGAFKRFREAVDEDDQLRRRWLAYRTKRHYLLALDWLHRLGADPNQYGLNPTDYDWHPPAQEPEQAAPAASPQEQKQDDEAQPATPAANGESAEATTPAVQTEGAEAEAEVGAEPERDQAQPQPAN